MELDKFSLTPLYIQLKEWIASRMEDGTYSPGSRIPSELELCESLDLSRPTVRQAVSELVAEGRLVIQRGKGTFVPTAQEPIEIHLASISHFSVLSSDLQENAELLSCDVRKGEKANREETEVRFRLFDKGIPYALCRSLVPVPFFPNLAPDLKSGRPLLERTANRYAYLPNRAKVRILVRASTEAEARRLRMSRSSPVLVLQIQYLSRSGDVCERSETVLRADRCVLDFDSSRSGASAP